MNYYMTQMQDNADSQLEKLPVARLKDLYATTFETPAIAEHFEKITDKAVYCMDQHVGTVSDQYVLVQHKDAFMPIVKALRESGKQFEFNMWATPKKAFFGVLVGKALDGVAFGFRAQNSVDGSGSIKYGLKAGQRTVEHTIVEKEKVLVWTVRQICTNGATIKVPLKTEKYLDVETRIKFQSIVSEVRSIRHKGNVEARLKEVQYLVEAFLLLEQPLNRMIADAQKIQMDQEEIRRLFKKYVGKRMENTVWRDFAHDHKSQGTLWDAFNAITSVASHNPLADGTREALLNKAADMLHDELVEYAEVI